MRGLKKKYLARLGGYGDFIEPPFRAFVFITKPPFQGWRALFAALPHSKKEKMSIQTTVRVKYYIYLILIHRVQTEPTAFI